MRKLGKKGLTWLKAREKLKSLYFLKGITRCEAKLVGCWRSAALSFAHKYRRSDPRCRHTFKQTILACIPCHQQMEQDKTLTEMLFKELRDTT